MTICEDPITEEKVEGDARLVTICKSCIIREGSLELWQVEFVGDDGIYYRKVLNKEPERIISY